MPMEVPKEVRDVDHSESEYMTPVLDQNDTGLCWVHVFCDWLEVLMRKKYGRGESLSMQQLIDVFDTSLKGIECEIDEVAEYVKKNGIISEFQFPFVGDKKHDAPRDSLPRAFIVRSIEKVPHDNFDAINEILQSEPLYITGASLSSFFRFKGSGIYEADPAEIERWLNLDKAYGHALLLVGVTVRNGIPCWKVKNSQGIHWGNEGFGLIDMRKYPIINAWKLNLSEQLVWKSLEWPADESSSSNDPACTMF